MQFVKEVCQILLQFIEKSFDRSTKVVEFLQPEELHRRIDFGLKDEPENLQNVLAFCRDALHYSVKTGIGCLSVCLYYTVTYMYACVSTCLCVHLSVCMRVCLFVCICAGHPYFFNQLFAGIDVISLMGDCLASAANASM